MLLEKQLLQIEDDGQRSRKRARTSAGPPSQVTTTWIELSKLVIMVSKSFCKTFAINFCTIF